MQWRDKKTVILFLEEITICFPEVLCQAIFVGPVHSRKSSNSHWFVTNCSTFFQNLVEVTEGHDLAETQFKPLGALKKSFVLSWFKSEQPSNYLVI